MKLKYNGLSGVVIKVIQKKDYAILFNQLVEPGGEFSIVGTQKKGTLGTEVKFYFNNTLHSALHTSCSKPIGIGTTAGDIEVVEGNSRNGGPLCEYAGEQ